MRNTKKIFNTAITVLATSGVISLVLTIKNSHPIASFVLEKWIENWTIAFLVGLPTSMLVSYILRLNQKSPK
jgi:hypothetical protein